MPTSDVVGLCWVAKSGRRRDRGPPTHAVAEAMDKINDRWGEFVITPALMMGMGDTILDRISFGGVKELEEIYSD